MNNDFIMKIIWLLVAICLSILGLWLVYMGITERNVTFGIIGGGILFGEILFFRMTAR